MSSTAKIAVLYYSMYGHVRSLANELVSSINSTGLATATLLQVPETLPETVLKAMHAPPKDTNVKVATANDLVEYDGILFGIPTRFGMAPAQMKAFMDSTGGLWVGKKLIGKPAGIFFSTGSQSGGQETTALTFLTQLTHHGMIYVPMGYMVPEQMDLTEVHGGSPYGPGLLAGTDGSRQISEIEKKIARAYGERFAKVVAKLAKM